MMFRPRTTKDLRLKILRPTEIPTDKSHDLRPWTTSHVYIHGPAISGALRASRSTEEEEECEKSPAPDTLEYIVGDPTSGGQGRLAAIPTSQWQCCREPSSSHYSNRFSGVRRHRRHVASVSAAVARHPSPNPSLPPPGGQTCGRVDRPKQGRPLIGTEQRA
jgi:hypothetical protein